MQDILVVQQEIVDHPRQQMGADIRFDVGLFNPGVVLSRHDHRVNAPRRTAIVLVFDRNLTLCIRAQIRHDALVLANARQFADQPVCIRDGERHKALRLAAGITEHDALIAGAPRIDAPLDILTLFVNGRQHGARFRIET